MPSASATIALPRPESYAAVARAEGFHPDTLHRWRTRGRDADRKRLTSDGSRLPKQPGRKRASIGRCDGEASRVLARNGAPGTRGRSWLIFPSGSVTRAGSRSVQEPDQSRQAP